MTGTTRLQLATSAVTEFSPCKQNDQPFPEFKPLVVSLDNFRFARDTSRASADIWSAPSLLFIRAKRYFNVTVAVAELVNAPETPVKVMV
jgi:hypothetical protein